MSRPLSSYCTLKGGTGFPESFQGNQEGDVAFIKVSDMSLPGNQRTITVANNYVDRIVAEQLNASAFPPRSTVFAKVGAALLLNRRRMLIEPTIIDNNMMAAVPTTADPEFLYHFLCSVDFANYVQTGALPSINQSTIGQIPFPEFSLSQQCRIAEILSTVDEAIEQTEALIAKYQQIKAGLMQDLFTRGITPDGHLRPTSAQAPHLYKESPLGWIPKEWEVKPLRDIATYQHGQPFPSTDYSDEGVLLLRPGNLHVSGVVRFDATHTTRIPQRWLRDCPELTVKQNDIVMNLTAQSLEDQFLGRVCIVKDGEPSLLNQRIARFFPRQVDHHFLYWILRSLQFRNQIDRTAQGTKVQHIYNSDLNRVMFPIPKTQQEQERVSGLLLTATESLVAGESSIAKLRQQKHGLMQDLLTGRVRVKGSKTMLAK